MSQPDPNACCPDAFYCPTAGETECPRHGGFTTCCALPDLHVVLDRDEWHVAQEHLEQALLTGYVNRRALYRGEDSETVRRLLLQE